MPHTHHVASESFSVTAALIVVALVYMSGWLRIRRFDPDEIANWRAASFLIGLLVIWVSVASPLAGLDHELLTAHMIQHLLLMTIAAPLIWLGTPIKPLLQGLPQRLVRALIAPLLRSSLAKHLGGALAHPAVCWFGASATLVAWHIPAVFMIGLRSEAWHAIEQASFLVTGLLFWWPVIQPWPAVSKWPQWSMLLYLFFATLPCDILSGFLVFCDRVVYPIYFCAPQPFGLSPLQDQQCAAALMWTCVTVVYLTAGSVVTAQLLSPRTSREYWIAASQTSTSPQTTRSLEVI